MAQKNFVGNTALGKAFELIRTWVTGELVKKADVSAVPTAVSQLTNDSNYQTKAQVDTALEAKQDKLTAGANITIQDGTISASGVLTEVSWGGITGTLASQTDLKTALDAKADATALTAHTGNNDIHVTSAKKAEWDAKVDAADIADFVTNENLTTTLDDYVTSETLTGYGYQNASQVGSAIDTKLTAYTTTEALTPLLAAKADASALTAHTGNATIHVTAENKQTWNAKQEQVVAGTGITLAADKKTISVNVAALDIPDAVSDLTNDAGYQTASDVNGLIATGIAGKADTTALTAHTGNTDIHVTAADKQKWNAKLDATAIADMATKTELAAKANSADVYTKTQIDEKGFQNASQVESAITAKGYQTQAQVSQAITDAVADITSFEFQVVGELPGTGTKGIIYLVAHTHGEGDTYDEYIWVNNAFEKIGNTDIDLSGYVLSTDLVEITAEEVQDLWDETMAA